MSEITGLLCMVLHVPRCSSGMGSSPRDNGLGGQYLGFNFIRWGVVLQTQK